jgi:hypothetical protein
MKVTITETEIVIDGAEYDQSAFGHGYTCRTASLEACAWAVKRLGHEMEKSAASYRTGHPTDSIVMGCDE